MDWLDNQWPELKTSYLDIAESTQNIATVTTASIVGADPHRIGLILSVPQGTSSFFFSTTNTTAANTGIAVSANFNQFFFVGTDYWTLAGKQWFGNNRSAAAVLVTFLTITMRRPAARPYTPADELNFKADEFFTKAAPSSNEKALMRLLQRQLKWRKKIYAQLRRQYYGASNLADAGRRVAAANPFPSGSGQGSVR